MRAGERGAGRGRRSQAPGLRGEADGAVLAGQFHEPDGQVLDDRVERGRRVRFRDVPSGARRAAGAGGALVTMLTWAAVGVALLGVGGMRQRARPEAGQEREPVSA